MTHEAEEWKDIPDYHGRYQASTLGRLKSVGNPRRRNPFFIMNPQPRGDAHYLGVTLYCPVTGKPRSQFVQVLVAATFLGPKPLNMQVNHLSGDKHDNRLANLEYATARDNTHHALRNGFKKISGTGSVLTPRQVLEIRELVKDYPIPGLSLRAIGRRYGTSHETIRQIRLGLRWQCLD